MTAAYVGNPHDSPIWQEIADERERQEEIGRHKRQQGIEWRSCADPEMDGGDATRFLVLGEEVGEVANAVLEAGYAMPAPTSVAYQVMESDGGRDMPLREELIQVAAVAVAWVEAIDARNSR
jgi:hypothetical protein